MTLAGKRSFLLMSCFNKMARGGLQPFSQWLSDHSAYGTSDSQVSLIYKHGITPGLAMGMELFFKGIRIFEPRIYHLGAARQPPVVIDSDAEWTVLEKPPWQRKGLGASCGMDGVSSPQPWTPRCATSTP